MTRVICLLLLQLPLLAPCRASADLYTAGVLSLEWIVDSADGIYRVKYRLPDEGDVPWAVPVETIKPMSGLIKAPNDFRDVPKPHGVQIGQEWLFFLRRSESSNHHVFRTINLSDPKKDFRTAAVMGDGTPILDRAAILSAVDQRLQQRQNVPAKCDRDLTDRLLKDGTKHIVSAGYRSGFSAPSPFDQFLGAMVVKIDCNTWDTLPSSLDTWLTAALVPIPLERRQHFLKAETIEDVAALVNFPGRETEGALKRVVETTLTSQDYQSSTRRLVAGKLLDVLRLQPKTDEAFFQAMLGQWRIMGRNEIIDIELTKDGRFSAVGYDRKGGQPTKQRWSGLGRWLLRYNEFSLLRSHVRYPSGLSNARRDIFRDKKVLSVTEGEIKLDGGPLMLIRPALAPQP